MGDLFGGGSKDAARAQTQATREAMVDYRRGVQEAKDELFPAMDRSTEQRFQRTQEARDMMDYGFAPEMEARTQGNMNAQALLAGTPQQQQNAILGMPVDYSGLQAQGTGFNASSFLSGAPQMSAPIKREPPESLLTGGNTGYNPKRS